MNTGKPMRVGIVGGGGAAQWHISAMLKINNVELVAICDRNEALARQVAGRFHISYYTELSEMLGKEKLDVVDICAPPQTHLALATQAMKAGCHVLTEKPMALSLEEADEMIVAAKANQAQLCVVHNELFLPVVIKARSMVSEGVVGEVVGISITDSLPRDSGLAINSEHWCHKLPGGIFGEMLPHPIYLAQAFLGRLEPVAVHSRKLGSYDWMVADELRVVLEGENGLATITESVNWPDDFTVLDIFGTKKSLHVDVWGMALTRYATAGESRFRRGCQNVEQSFQRLAGTASTTLSLISGRFRGGHFNLIQKFFESLQSGTEMPVTTEEARDTIRLYQAITAQI